MKGLLAVLLIGLLGCGADPHRPATVSGINAAPLSVSGFVNRIQLTTSATSLGSNSLVTIVTFIPQLPQNTPAVTLTFCGNVANQFIQNTFATVQFTQGMGCSTIVSLLPTSFVSITGFISIVQLTGSANNSLVTQVTFILPDPQNGLTETLVFCGNVASQFMVNGLMTVSFSQGQGCATIISAFPV
jgi:hypothetical protein